MSTEIKIFQTLSGGSSVPSKNHLFPTGFTSWGCFSLPLQESYTKFSLGGFTSFPDSRSPLCLNKLHIIESTAKGLLSHNIWPPNSAAGQSFERRPRTLKCAKGSIPSYRILLLQEQMLRALQICRYPLHILRYPWTMFVDHGLDVGTNFVSVHGSTNAVPSPWT